MNVPEPTLSPEKTAAAAAGAPFRIARTREEILGAAAARGLAIPAECLEGVEANMALLASHAARLTGGAPLTGGARLIGDGSHSG